MSPNLFDVNKIIKHRRSKNNSKAKAAVLSQHLGHVQLALLVVLCEAETVTIHSQDCDQKYQKSISPSSGGSALLASLCGKSLGGVSLGMA